MEFVESLKRNLLLFKQKFENCIDIPSAQEKVKSVLTHFRLIKFAVRLIIHILKLQVLLLMPCCLLIHEYTPGCFL